MALFTGGVRADYPRPHMPQPKRGDGPWGEAIVYWLKDRNMRPAELARATGVRPNTISRIVRGFDTTTRVLRLIAAALDLPIDAVLISPDRKSANEARKQMILEVTERVVRHIDQSGLPALPQAKPLHAQDLQRLADDAVRALTAEDEQSHTDKRLPLSTKRKTESAAVAKRLGRHK
jgi:transcriptional regulator with XRE-family HTH domain